VEFEKIRKWKGQPTDRKTEKDGQDERGTKEAEKRTVLHLSQLRAPEKPRGGVGWWGGGGGGGGGGWGFVWGGG